ncbi:hypothetical protein B0H17DRAFT_1171071 [Mycena rosella]|uniref:NmrA-like domain-containing protein n=1 Tax=Mycena rosella TaxID=1033263 RepID=A0AAD7CY45_MYCRO|nr:hypothetical protein B0H17DRAFT_1171071 [Mycena rosella]
MTILFIGGTGKSATPLAHLLVQANKPVLLATRSGKVPAPFTGALDATIDRIYRIAPRVVDMLPPMKAFIDFAIKKGVKRFVLMSPALLEAGGPGMGLVHAYLASLQVEYCVLRPSSFFDNLALIYSDGIRANDEILSAAEGGLIEYISTDDIVGVAFKALVDDVIEDTQPIPVGPELFSYDQIARMLSEVLGREIKHKRLTVEEFAQCGGLNFALATGSFGMCEAE